MLRDFASAYFNQIASRNHCGNQLDVRLEYF